MRIIFSIILSAGVALGGPRGSLDPRTASYSDRVHDGSGQALPMLGRAQVGGFIRNHTVIALWPHMVCWPLRSSQNAGAWTTVYSLGGLGTYDGTLVNGPTWGANGVQTVGGGNKISTTLSTVNNFATIFSAWSLLPPYETANRIFTANQTNSTQGIRLDINAGRYRIIVNNTVTDGGVYSGGVPATHVLRASNNPRSDFFLNGAVAGSNGNSYSAGLAFYPMGMNSGLPVGIGGIISFSAYVDAELSDLAISQFLAIYKSTLDR